MRAFIAALVLLIFSLTAKGEDKTPILVGVEGLDACLTLGQTRSSTGDVNVYASPDPKSTILERVKTGTYVMICEAKGESWLGIVYDRSGDHAACGVSSSISPRQPYNGKCQSGWVKADNIEPLAG